MEAEAQRLSRAGLRRLGDDDLAAWAGIMARAYASVDTATCIAVAYGSGGAADAHRLIASLNAADSATVERFAAITTRATAAEVRNTPDAAVPTEAETDAAFRALLDAVPPADVERFAATLEAPNAGSKRDACDAAVTMFRVASTLPSPHRGNLLRYLVGAATPPQS